MPDSVATDLHSETDSVTSEIRQEVQKQMYRKARNYVGHHMLLKQGKITMEKAKEKKALAKYKEEKKAERMAKLDEYVTDVLSTSNLQRDLDNNIAGRIDSSVYMLNMLHTVDLNDSMID